MYRMIMACKRSLVVLSGFLCTSLPLIVDGFSDPGWRAGSPFLFRREHPPTPSSSLPTTSFDRCNVRLCAKAGGKKGKQPSAKKKAPVAASSSAPKRKKSTPPWQVLNTKEQKKNVEMEKKRRELAQQGVHNTGFTNDTPQVLSKSFLSTPDQKLLKWKRFNPTTAPAAIKFVGSYLGQRLPPRLGVPEVAFLGRSNVGKSSLLNKLSFAASSGTQARVGKTPGATASVNLYSLHDAKDRELLAWVDLPGFGYAKLSKDVKESVQEAAEYYLGKRKELALGILLVDIRRTPSDDDRAVLAALYDMGVPIVVVATKIDKVSDNERSKCIETIREGLGLAEGQPLTVSSVSGEGCRRLWTIILEACEAGVEDFRVKYDADLAQTKEQMAKEEEVFEDDDDFAYSQGYDWIQDSAVLYEGDDEDFVDDDDWSETEEDDEGLPPIERETLRSLRRKARDLERRGEL